MICRNVVVVGAVVDSPLRQATIEMMRAQSSGPRFLFFVLFKVTAEAHIQHNANKKVDKEIVSTVLFFLVHFSRSLYVCVRASEWPNFRMNSIFNLCHFDKIVAYERRRRNENGRSSQSVGYVTIYRKYYNFLFGEYSEAILLLFFIYFCVSQ